jgi:hypothetical protein
MTDAPYTINQAESLAVAEGYFWQPMTTCPLHVKVQLLGRGGIPQYASWDGRNAFWTAWAPLPRRRKSDADQPQAEAIIQHKEYLGRAV